MSDGGGRPPIPDEDLLAEIRQLADELGREPFCYEIHELGEYSQTPYYRAFGTMTEAKEAAGVVDDDPSGKTEAMSESDDGKRPCPRCGERIGKTWWPQHLKNCTTKWEGVGE